MYANIDGRKIFVGHPLSVSFRSIYIYHLWPRAWSRVGVCALCRFENESKGLDTLNHTRSKKWHRSDRTAIKPSEKGSTLKVTLLPMWTYLTKD